MTPQAEWPAETLTREALVGALQAIDEPWTDLDHLVPTAVSSTVATSHPAACQQLVAAAATPEQRLNLAGVLGCSYADLTNWVIRADLLELEGVDAAAARALAHTGILGVHDLAAWTSEPRRLEKLHQALVQTQPNLAARISAGDLEQWGQRARQLPSRVTAETTVIVVVKGAGVQKPEDTLNQFLNGFWPAVKSLDPAARLAQRHDVFPANYRSTPYDQRPLNLVTEISSGERRIWIKEPHWDVACIPSSPLTVLSNEWRMATYAFGSWLHEFWAVQDTRLRRRPEVRRKDAWRYLMANVLLNWAILLQVSLTLIWAHLSGSLPGGLQQSVSRGSLILFLGLASALLGLLLAIPPAVKTNVQMKAYLDENRPLTALPGMTGWGLILLLGAFLISPWSYLVWLFFWVTLQLALLRARAMAWPFRELANSDASSEDYYSVKGETHPGTGAPRIYKRGNRASFWRRLFVLIYRYIVVLGLPITYLGLMLARFLKWTRILGGLGEAIESALAVALSSVLGDVVTYAMDPAQANRIRHVVQTDLMFFHERADVASLHVFAHSQGTPVTFETLFHYLPTAYCRKIKTYMTIGSVLSYYHQTNPMLDPVYVERFPIRPYRDFAPGFKWMNFWNLSDPITEFYGLDEYNLVQEAPVLELDPAGQPKWLLDKQIKRTQTKRYGASPTNIKTHASLKNHGEYWSNIDQVQRPFARRVLGDQRPPEWNPDELKTLWSGLTHGSAVTLLWLIWILLFAPAVWLLHLVWPLATFTGPLADRVHNWSAGVLPPQPGLLGGGLSWLEQFAAELSLALVTAVLYFAIVGGLNTLYTALIDGYSALRNRRPAAPAPSK